MTTVLLLRHGRTTANAKGELAGWLPGVQLDDTGQRQAKAAADRLAALPLSHLVTSPLLRTVETARAIAAVREIRIQRDRRLGECDYGDWTGQPLKQLAKDPLWSAVQTHPSAVVFPGGEAMSAAQQRAVTACREWALRAQSEAGDQALVAIVSHGDVIKAILADALGMHLDLFQRIIVDPGSLSVIQYTQLRPFVERINDTGSDVRSLIPPKPKRGRRRQSSATSSDAAVGGGAGARSAD